MRCTSAVFTGGKYGEMMSKRFNQAAKLRSSSCFFYPLPWRGQGEATETHIALTLYLLLIIRASLWPGFSTTR